MREKTNYNLEMINGIEGNYTGTINGITIDRTGRIYYRDNQKKKKK